MPACGDTHLELLASSALFLYCAVRLCMDANRFNHPDSYQSLRPRRHRYPDPEPHEGVPVPAPLQIRQHAALRSWGDLPAQRSWEDIAVAFRPRHQVPDTQAPATANEPSFAWRLRRQSRGSNDREQIQRTQSSNRARRRPTRLQPSQLGQEVRPGTATPDPSLLTAEYSQGSPYGPPSLSPGWDTMHARSVSQPNTPSWLSHTTHSASTSNLHVYIDRPLPRLPPAATSHETFTSSSEYQLFVEATSGLSPDRAPSASLSQQNEGAQPPFGGHNGVGSPVQETPTTLRALAQLAQEPEMPPALTRRSVTYPPASGGPSPLHPSQLPWTRPPVAGRRRARAYEVDFYDVSPVEEDEDVDDDDDELPDYDSSQRMMHAQQREEATRRAQELQRRWRESGGAGGFR